ncbi:hypothetical protein IU485_13630 [Nocardia cyriacigeorgica]|uniref:hypothetical protein n=1 Tax=Nocardia cyriacigeorgica TaxID=135487 RepID=UPI001893098E|nr:hypothetical protein [Nocardia cyriacigeorgica]MBF6082401.1 hypothetical protein [Nocardia cyriacigeorgica]MBF6426533.1 hypothetical protein [Nocardia cyriacigeorgica]
MGDEQPIDYAEIRRRFPWAGLIDTGAGDLSSRYREIMTRPTALPASEPGPAAG